MLPTLQCPANQNKTWRRGGDASCLFRAVGTSDWQGETFQGRGGMGGKRVRGQTRIAHGHCPSQPHRGSANPKMLGPWVRICASLCLFAALTFCFFSHSYFLFDTLRVLVYCNFCQRCFSVSYKPFTYNLALLVMNSLPSLFIYIHGDDLFHVALWCMQSTSIPVPA